MRLIPKILRAIRKDVIKQRFSNGGDIRQILTRPFTITHHKRALHLQFSAESAVRIPKDEAAGFTPEDVQNAIRMAVSDSRTHTSGQIVTGLDAIRDKLAEITAEPLSEDDFKPLAEYLSQMLNLVQHTPETLASATKRRREAAAEYHQAFSLAQSH